MTTSLNITEELDDIRNKGLFRRLTPVASQCAPVVSVNGRQVLLLCSNDYLGLSSHPQMKAAAARAVQLWGTGSGASRLISGNSLLYDVLEHKLAAFKKTEAALVFSTGYMANQGLLTALAGSADAVYSDALNHASIIDACRLSRAAVSVYPHCDMDALDRLLTKGSGFRRRIIVTDSVFSMDGDIAPLDQLYALAQTHDALLMVDDAHATGVLGETGTGALEHFNLQGCPDILVMGTLGKALGCFGAFVACTKASKDYFINRSRSLIYTTALPPAVLASAAEAVDILNREPERVRRLQDNSVFLRTGLQQHGFDIPAGNTPIIALIAGAPETATALSERLFDEGFFIQAVRPPSVPEGSSRLRITVSSEHTPQQLSSAAEAVFRICRHAGVV